MNFSLLNMNNKQLVKHKSKITMGSFKKYVHYKLPVFDPPPLPLVCSCLFYMYPPPPLPATYVHFSELTTPVKKSSATLMTLISNKKSESEKRKNN